MIACNSGLNDGRNGKSPINDGLQNVDSSNNLEVNKTDTFLREKQLLFKKWLVDTLKVLNISIANFNANGIGKEVTMSLDSLSLSINNIYDLPNYADKDTRMEDVRKVLTLLKEYDEYPKGRFTLKFKSNYFFIPSHVSELTYEMVFDLEDVEIIEQNGNKASRYDIVRGRLGDKHVTTLLENDDKKEEYIEFLWKDNKLVKKKRL